MRCCQSLLRFVALLVLPLVCWQQCLAVAALPDVVVAAAPQTPGQRVIQSVPEGARSAFIRYQLALALNANNSYAPNRPSPRFDLTQTVVTSREAEEFQAIPTYATFSADLLRWYQTEFGLNDQAIYSQLSSRQENIMCTSSGVCFKNEDIGCYCCPF